MEINLIISIGFLVLSLLLLTYKKWLIYISPELFVRINVISDNKIDYNEKLLFLPLQKNKTDFTIEGNLYSIKGKKPKRFKKIYSYFFERGNAIPIDFNIDTEKYIDSELARKLENIKLDDLWVGGGGLTDFLRDYGILIVLVVIIGLFLYVMNQNAQVTQAIKNISVVIPKYD